LAPLFPYVVDAVDIGQSATAVEPYLFDFALHRHFDVESIGRTQFVPPNPGFEVVATGFLVLGYGHGDGVEHIGGLNGGVAGTAGVAGCGAVCCSGLNEEIEVDRHHHFTAAFKGYAVVVAGSERCDAFDAIIGGFVGLKPLIEEGVKVGLCTLDDRISKVFDVGVTEFPLFYVVFHGLQEDRIAQVVLEVVEHRRGFVVHVFVAAPMSGRRMKIVGVGFEDFIGAVDGIFHVAGEGAFEFGL
ncbi:MAG: hypothetical protein RLZZ465_230, partial [Bacteroidota bacterium]